MSVPGATGTVSDWGSDHEEEEANGIDDVTFQRLMSMDSLSDDQRELGELQEGEKSKVEFWLLQLDAACSSTPRDLDRMDRPQLSNMSDKSFTEDEASKCIMGILAMNNLDGQTREHWLTVLVTKHTDNLVVNRETFEMDRQKPVIVSNILLGVRKMILANLISFEKNPRIQNELLSLVEVVLDISMCAVVPKGFESVALQQWVGSEDCFIRYMLERRRIIGGFTHLQQAPMNAWSRIRFLSKLLREGKGTVSPMQLRAINLSLLVVGYAGTKRLFGDETHRKEFKAFMDALVSKGILPWQTVCSISITQFEKQGAPMGPIIQMVLNLLKTNERDQSVDGGGLDRFSVAVFLLSWIGDCQFSTKPKAIDKVIGRFETIITQCNNQKERAEMISWVIGFLDAHMGGSGREFSSDSIDLRREYIYAESPSSVPLIKADTILLNLEFGQVMKMFEIVLKVLLKDEYVMPENELKTLKTCLQHYVEDKSEEKKNKDGWFESGVLLCGIIRMNLFRELMETLRKYCKDTKGLFQRIAKVLFLEKDNLLRDGVPFTFFSQFVHNYHSIESNFEIPEEKREINDLVVQLLYSSLRRSCLAKGCNHAFLSSLQEERDILRIVNGLIGFSGTVDVFQKLVIHDAQQMSNKRLARLAACVVPLDDDVHFARDRWFRQSLVEYVSMAPSLAEIEAIFTTLDFVEEKIDLMREISLLWLDKREGKLTFSDVKVLIQFAADPGTMIRRLFSATSNKEQSEVTEFWGILYRLVKDGVLCTSSKQVLLEETFRVQKFFEKFPVDQMCEVQQKISSSCDKFWVKTFSQIARKLKNKLGNEKSPATLFFDRFCEDFAERKLVPLDTIEQMLCSDNNNSNKTTEPSNLSNIVRKRFGVTSPSPPSNRPGKRKGSDEFAFIAPKQKPKLDIGLLTEKQKEAKKSKLVLAGENDLNPSQMRDDDDEELLSASFPYSGSQMSVMVVESDDQSNTHEQVEKLLRESLDLLDQHRHSVDTFNTVVEDIGKLASSSSFSDLSNHYDLKRALELKQHQLHDELRRRFQELEKLGDK